MWPGTESNCRHEDFQSPYDGVFRCYATGPQLNEFTHLNSPRCQSIFCSEHSAANNSKITPTPGPQDTAYGMGHTHNEQAAVARAIFLPVVLSIFAPARFPNRVVFENAKIHTRGCVGKTQQTPNRLPFLAMTSFSRLSENVGTFHKGQTR